MSFPDKSATERSIAPALDIRATDILLKLGIPASSQGYCYLRSAIILACHDPGSTQYITKNLYPKVARLCHACSTESVERNCRRAVDRAFICRTETLTECFGVTASSLRPTCAQFILTIAKRLRNEEDTICCSTPRIE